MFKKFGYNRKKAMLIIKLYSIKKAFYVLVHDVILNEQELDTKTAFRKDSTNLRITSVVATKKESVFFLKLIFISFLVLCFLFLSHINSKKSDNQMQGSLV